MRANVTVDPSAGTVQGGVEHHAGGLGDGGVGVGVAVLATVAVLLSKNTGVTSATPVCVPGVRVKSTR